MPLCKRFEDDIFDYVDGLLFGPRKKELDKHFEECSPCSRAFEEIKRVRSQLRKLRPLRTSADFETVLRSRISLERSLRRGALNNWPVRIPLYAAAGALIVIATLFVLQPTNDNTITGNFNKPLNIGPSLPNPNLSDDSNTNSQSHQENIFYPMDEMKLSVKGVPLNSGEMDRRFPAKSDSVQNPLSTQRIQTVEF